MNKKVSAIIVLALCSGLLLSSCSIPVGDQSETILLDQPGTLVWAGTPMNDGLGILFKTEKKTYGAPGTREDYQAYFRDQEYEVQIIADIRLTGEKTIRGLSGTKYPAIKFLDIRKAN